VDGPDLNAVIQRQVKEVCAVKEKFFTEQAGTIAACARAMAKRFDAGGRFYAMGNGGSLCDTIHFSVEFMHPIIEKRPAPPAIALTSDFAILTAIGNDQDFSFVFAQQLKMLGKAGDMALGVSTKRQERQHQPRPVSFDPMWKSRSKQASIAGTAALRSRK
jgi:D-sedoheptulose 7-phosphate isomerase